MFVPGGKDIRLAFTLGSRTTSLIWMSIFLNIEVFWAKKMSGPKIFGSKKGQAKVEIIIPNPVVF